MGTYLLCIKHTGKTYCWNSETEQIEEISSKPLHISECPEIVVSDFIKLLSRKATEKEEK